MSESAKLLSITKEIDELSPFEKLFLLDRIWKELALAIDGLMIGCASNEYIMAEVMEHTEDESIREALDGSWLEGDVFDNVTFITRNKNRNKLN